MSWLEDKFTHDLVSPNSFLLLISLKFLPSNVNYTPGFYLWSDSFLWVKIILVLSIYTSDIHSGYIGKPDTLQGIFMKIG